MLYNIYRCFSAYFQFILYCCVYIGERTERSLFIFVSADSIQINVEELACKCNEYFNSDSFNNYIIDEYLRLNNFENLILVHLNIRYIKANEDTFVSVTGRFAHGQFAQNGPPKVRLF